MKKIERYNLINAIALHLQANMNTTGINVFLGGFGVEHGMQSYVPSKRVYVEELLTSATDDIIIEIANELDIPIPNLNSENISTFKSYLETGGFTSALKDFERALKNLNSDPEQALGNASSTLESICKEILNKFGENLPKDESLQPLVNSVFNKMNLSPQKHADADIKRVLGGLFNTAVGLGVIRTKYSSFHGKSNTQKKNNLGLRHARLMINSAATIGLFLIETYNERFK